MNYYRGSCGGVIENYNKYLEKIPDTWKMVGSGELSWEDSEKLRIYMKNIGGQEFWVLMGFAEECSRELGLDGEANQYLDYIKKAQT
jgi:hypothetical protein